MRDWPVQDAQARFGEMLEACLNEGPQVVTQRGANAAVLVPAGDWEHLQRTAMPTLKSLLLVDDGRGDLVLPRRGRSRRRAADGA